MKVLVFGATGYLGKKLIARLLYRNEDVYALVRRSSTIFYLIDIGMNKNNIWFIEDLGWHLKEVKIECMVNCVCCYEKAGVSPENIMEANYVQPLRVFFTCMAHDIKQYLNIGTGLPADFNLYTKSKALFGEMLHWYSKKENLCVYNVLLENYYGEDEPSDRFLTTTFEKLIKNEDVLLTEGDQRRDIIYIGDVIDALEYILNYIENDYGYNEIPLGTGEGPTIREIIEYMAQITESQSNLLFGKIKKRPGEPNSIADMNIMNKMGWNVQYGWKSGLKKVYGKNKL